MDIEPEVLALIQNAKRVTILTGAGVSAESGVATFRAYKDETRESLWSQYDPQKMASIDGFLENPNLVWQWYQWRRRELKNKKPNDAHKAIAKWQQSKSLGLKQQTVTLITQNVDGLHQAGGSRDVIELHGNIWRNHCLQCRAEYKVDVTGIESVTNCPECGGQVRPSVVWFGEALPEQAWRDAESASYSCDLFLSVGTSSQVYPAAGLATLAKSQGAKVIEINPEPTESSVVDYFVLSKAGVFLNEIEL
ncbi:SIR2 family NAD-dependent protein deacylase [Kangiella spongicola]|uniref:NAD-dependent protein deacylase n=1 Tax=Kangiella spongicola TaxID=796379 RepID=A0A318D804_9GAMM|nr:NAD-dependent deacylase [Kangiella spongicola]PXF63928.1 NAD-dependent protein deacylase [Kangiella spongicola]